MTVKEALLAETLWQTASRIYIRQAAVVLGMDKPESFISSTGDLVEWVVTHAPAASEGERIQLRAVLPEGAAEALFLDTAPSADVPPAAMPEANVAPQLDSIFDGV